MLPLSSREKDVLTSVELHAEIEIKEIARLCKIRSHTANYTLQRLKERGILGPRRAVVDVYKLGYTNFTIFFSTIGSSKTRRTKFLNSLKLSPNIAWVAEVGGRFQFAVGIFARYITEIVPILVNLATLAGVTITNKEVSSRDKIVTYGRKYLSNIARQTLPLSYGGSHSQYQLEEIDLKILNGLANINHSSFRELSRLLGIPIATFDRHFKKLRERKIIGGIYYAIDSTSFGIQVFNLLVCFRNIEKKHSAKIEEFCKEHPNIVHFISCVGSWDFEVVVEVYDSKDASQIANDLSEKFDPNISSIEILPVFSYLRATPFPMKHQ